jgi:hypothetical protein
MNKKTNQIKQNFFAKYRVLGYVFQTFEYVSQNFRYVSQNFGYVSQSWNWHFVPDGYITKSNKYK